MNPLVYEQIAGPASEQLWLVISVAVIALMSGGFLWFYVMPFIKAHYDRAKEWAKKLPLFNKSPQ